MKTKLLYLLLFVCSYSYAQIPTSGLYANYDFTNGALTDAANATTLTQTGTALTTINNRFTAANNALNLNGDYLTRTNVEFPGSSLGANYDNNGTVSFWIKTTTNDTNERVIIDDSNRSNLSSTSWAGYYLFLQDGQIGMKMGLQFVSNSGYNQYRFATKKSDPIISDGNWHHVAMTIGNTYNVSSSGLTIIIRTRARVYIDGIDQGQIAIDESGSSSVSFRLLQSHDTNGNFTVGNNRSNNLPGANKYEGAVDDLNIYNRQVTQAEVTQLATVNSFCFPPQVSTISTSNITETTANVSWTESGTFDLAYVKKGEAFSNATIVSNINYTANTAQSLTGLQPSTIYNIYLRNPCTASTTSAWSIPKELRTNGITYVDQNATGANDGTSWANAFTDLQDAIAILQDNGKIWIAQGTYTPGATDRNSSFIINKTNVKLYGGFNGTETALNQRDFRANETILSGDLLGNDAGNITGNTRIDNAYHVIEVDKNLVVIDGLTIRDGFANSSGDNAAGGGIFKKKSVKTLTVKNSTIKNNLAYNSAGIYAEYTTSGVGTLTIESCVFDNNLARLSASFSAWARTGGTFTFKISNSLFSNNETRDLSGSGNGVAGSAGWLRAIGNGGTVVNASLVNNTYVNNNDIGTHSSVNNLNRTTVAASQTNGGGILNLEVANSIFWNNTIVGGAVANSITGVADNLGQNVTATNSIDQASFSKLTAANVTNTSNADPLFTSATDFTLQASSPAINLGLSSYLPATITEDLLGNDRISAGAIDAGVYEYQCAACLGVNMFTVGNGSVTQSGALYASGDSVTLTATPDAGYQFDGWSGDATGNVNPLTLTINSNLNITATFSKLKTYVNKNATGNNDGTSWADAYVSLQDAVTNASVNEVIWIAAGTYNPGTTINDSFTFSEVNMKVYGGFNGNEATLQDRNFSAQTILSGDINGDDTGVGITGFNRSDNSLIVVKVNGNNILFDGLVISDGHDDRSAQGKGSGIFMDSSVTNFTLRNCEINNNFSYNHGAFSANFNLGGSLIIENCKFDNNNARYGAGVYVLTGASQTLTVDVINSLFTNNITKDRTSAQGFTGSSMWIRANGNNSSLTTTITNSTFAKNTDIGTRTVSGRGTLGLSRRTDGNSTHSLTINNSIFYHNVGTNGVTRRSINQGHTYFPGTSDINNTIDEDNFSIFNSINHLNNVSDSDPLFNDVANNDFTLQSGSPAINSGDNTKIPSGILIDLSGNQRIVNNIVDMGPYEYDASLIQRTLTINATNGTVTTNPNPTNGTYDDGTSVVLTATPNAGYQFDGWSGDASGASTTASVVMFADRTVTATFSLIQRTLTVNATNGSVTTNPNPTNGTYNDGAVVALTATPDAGYQFDGWSGDVSGTTNPLNITMDADKTVTATFSLIQRTLTINATNGTVTTNPNPTNGTYDNGTVVALTATPAAGYQFDSFTVSSSGSAFGQTTTSNPLNITMDADKTVTANFSLIKRTLTVNATNGSVTTNPNPTNGTYNDGTVVALTATPDAGYQFDGWSGDASGTTNPLNITMDADKTITANFSKIQHTLTINATNGSVTASPAPTNGTYDNGTVVTLTATPDANFGFVNWTGDLSGTTNPITIIMSDDKNVTANFSTTASINEFDKLSLKIYPNPVSSVLNIVMKSEIKSVEIFNLIGKRVLQFTNKKINISQLPTGLYILKIETVNGSIGTRKIMKK